MKPQATKNKQNKTSAPTATKPTTPVTSEGTSSSWGGFGYDKLDAAMRSMENKKNAPRRFWTPPTKAGSAGVKILFLNDKPWTIYEHAIRSGRSKLPDFYTCRNEMDPGEACPLCQLPDSMAYFAACYTIIDGSSWTDQQNKVHVNEKRLFVAKMQAAAILRRRAEEYKGLRGCIFEVFRSSDRASNVGDDFKFIKKLNNAEIVKFCKDPEKAQSYDFEKMTKPLPREELQKVARIYMPVSSNAGGGWGSTSSPMAPAMDEGEELGL